MKVPNNSDARAAHGKHFRPKLPDTQAVVFTEAADCPETHPLPDSGAGPNIRVTRWLTGAAIRRKPIT
jgi:hypothetical protein